MTARRWLIAAALAFGCLGAPLQAKTDPAAAEFRQFRAGEPIALRPDRAYVLLRLDTDLSKFTAIIMRVPGDDEMAAYAAARQEAYAERVARRGDKAGPIESFVFAYEGRPNLFALNPGRSLVTIDKHATVLAELTPGDYVFYGEGYGSFLYECFCLGTVGFTLRPGEVADMGTMLVAKAWEPSPHPELAGEVDLGRSAMMDYGLFAVALRPARPADWMPPGLDAARVTPARFRAVGPFVETNTVLINRLAPMPGVLAYDQGKVIDVATGAEVPPNWSP